MSETLERRSFLIMMIVVNLSFIYILNPFYSVIFWSCVISIIFYPLQRYFVDKLNHNRNIAALEVIAICSVLVIVPIIFVVMSFFQEGVSIYNKMQDGLIDPSVYIERVNSAFPMVQNLFDRLGIDVEKLQSQIADFTISSTQIIAHNAVSLGQGTFNIIMNIGLLLYVTFFLLRDGPQLIALMILALPLGDEREKMLFAKFSEVTRATVKGNLVVAIVQGSLGSFIFWALGVPGVLLWGVVMTLFSLVPLIGAGLIWGPASIYFFAVGDWVNGLILLFFGIGVIGLVDNFLRPILVGRDSKLPDYMVLLSTLGGFAFFGMNGFVIGPLLAALFVTVWEIFIREFNRSDYVKGMFNADMSFAKDEVN